MMERASYLRHYAPRDPASRGLECLLCGTGIGLTRKSQREHIRKRHPEAYP